MSSDDSEKIIFNFKIPNVPLAQNDESDSPNIQDDEQKEKDEKDEVDSNNTSTSTTEPPSFNFFGDLEYDMSIFDLKRVIEQMCSRIFRAMGPGFREKVYQRCLEEELHNAGILFKSEFPVSFFYLDRCIGIGYSDIIVQNRLVLELKSIAQSIGNPQINQCIQYMRALDIKHGLVINFPQHRKREQEVDIFDCYLGKSISVSKMVYDQTRMADQGHYGPHPKKRPRSLTFFETYDIMEPEIEGIGDKRKSNDDEEKEKDDAEKKDKKSKDHAFNDDEQEYVPDTSVSTFYLPTGDQVQVKIVRPK